MIISVLSPHAKNIGVTTTAMLTAMGLADFKRKVLLTHVEPRSLAFELYLGLKAYEDKTSTPSQLVKLMREGAIKAEEIGDFCKTINDYLDVFTNNATNFSSEDMGELIRFLLTSSTPYDYMVFDIDGDSSSKEAQFVLGKSDLVLLNVSNSYLEATKFVENKDFIMKLCAGKKVILVCNGYDSKIGKLKDLSKKLGVDTSIFVIRRNAWVAWACNNGKLGYLFSQGRMKDPDVYDIYKDSMILASAVSKAKVAIAKGKRSKGVTIR